MKILVVDDEQGVRTALSDELRDSDNQVEEASNGEEALKLLSSTSFDLVISDVVMPGCSGMELLHYIKEHVEDTELILMTAYGTVEAAVSAVKAGAIDYICKPFNVDNVVNYISSIDETVQLRKENQKLRHLLDQRRSFKDIVGDCNRMRLLFTYLEAISDSNATILIEGETGTGKELVALAVHNASSRHDKPFVAVSCAALTKELLESELFGHEQGSFTGATKKKRGRFELADKGTLFLDEVDDIPMETQVKLLRALQAGTFERVGGEETLHVDVRILAATKRNLFDLVAADKFRRDLYYRLNVLTVTLPPLRERKEDIPLLCKHFLQKFSPDQNLEIGPDIMNLLMAYHWDGNVRELEHTIQRLVLLRRNGKIHPEALPAAILQRKPDSLSFDWGNSALPDHLENVERTIIQQALGRVNGSKTQAAALLRIPLPTLKSKIAKLAM